MTRKKIIRKTVSFNSKLKNSEMKKHIKKSYIALLKFCYIFVRYTTYKTSQICYFECKIIE